MKPIEIPIILRTLKPIRIKALCLKFVDVPAEQLKQLYEPDIELPMLFK